MSVKDRRKRETLHMRQAIVKAAWDIAAEYGWQAVTLRKVADKIEYSPAALYEYFCSKESILLELMKEGFLLLTQQMRSVPEEITGVERLIAVAHSYWAFAFRHPELYQVMHGLDGVSFGTVETPQEARDGFIVLRDAVRGAMPADNESESELYDEVDMFWAMLHGLVSLTMSKRIKGGKDRAVTLVEPAIAIYVAEWQKPRCPMAKGER